MTKDEALKQALEALEFYYEQHGEESDAKVITALRERLAQPEMQPCAGRNCGSTNPNLHSAECFEDYEKATGMNQRKPLSDEEIDVLVMDSDGTPNSHLEFARAIEAAHGIKEWAAVRAEREAIAQSLDKQADLAADDIDRQWAMEMAKAVRSRSNK